MGTGKQTYDNPIAEPEHQDYPNHLLELGWQNEDINEFWLDLSAPYVRPQYTLSYHGIPFAPLGGIHGLTGQAGHGKTAFFTMLMIAILKGDYCGLHYELSRTIPHPKVLYIDTEMELGNTQLVVKRLYKMMGWTRETVQDQFRVLRLREEDHADKRWLKTLKAIYEFRPTVVFLDGFIDVVGDFNDNKESSIVIYQDMKTASFYNLSFWNLIHQNPGSTKMVGHSGSFLERKGTDVFMVQKDKEGGVVSFTAKQLKARGRDVEEMTFLFGDDEEHMGIPFIDEKAADEKKEGTKKQEPTDEEIENYVSVIGCETVSYRKLRESIKEKFHVGADKAKEYIMRACTLGILTVADNKYSANPIDRFKETKEELPF